MLSRKAALYASRSSSLAGALPAPFLGVEAERPIDLHAIAVSQLKVEADALAEYTDRFRFDAGCTQCIANARTYRQLEPRDLGPIGPRGDDFNADGAHRRVS